MPRPRIIPVLLLQDQYLVKTVQFRKPNYIGDPIKRRAHL
jgi:imidazole glycerol-phosphate synthase subunit HisF